MAEKKKRIASLEKELRRHRQLYYNEQPEISDAEFDELVDELVEHFSSDESIPPWLLHELEQALDNDDTSAGPAVEGRFVAALGVTPSPRPLLGAGIGPVSGTSHGFVATSCSYIRCMVLTHPGQGC